MPTRQETAEQLQVDADDLRDVLTNMIDELASVESAAEDGDHETARDSIGTLHGLADEFESDGRVLLGAIRRMK